MATPSVKIAEHPILLHTDKIVRRLDDFPELLQALRDGDLVTVRLIWGQLVDVDGGEFPRTNQHPPRKAAMKAH
jgi:hypothetical protein